MEKYFDSRLNLAHRKGAAAIWRVIAKNILEQAGEVQKNRILDLGAGYGDFINGVSAQEKWAVDLWPGFLKNLSPETKGMVADIRFPVKDLPLEYFDFCFMSNVLEHFVLEDAQKILQLAHQYLKPGGSLGILQPNFTLCFRNYFDDYTHKTIFTAGSLDDFLQDNGFLVKKNIAGYLPFSFKSSVPRPPWLVELYLRSPYKPMAAQMLLIAQKQDTKNHVEK